MQRCSAKITGALREGKSPDFGANRCDLLRLLRESEERRIRNSALPRKLRRRCVRENRRISKQIAAISPRCSVRATTEVSPLRAGVAGTGARGATAERGWRDALRRLAGEVRAERAGLAGDIAGARQATADTSARVIAGAVDVARPAATADVPAAQRAAAGDRARLAAEAVDAVAARARLRAHDVAAPARRTRDRLIARPVVERAVDRAGLRPGVARRALRWAAVRVAGGLRVGRHAGVERRCDAEPVAAGPRSGAIRLLRTREVAAAVVDRAAAGGDGREPEDCEPERDELHGVPPIEKTTPAP